MKHASIKQFVKLRQQLEAERADIVSRLKQVEAALGSFQVEPSPKAIKTPKVKSPRKRAKNELSLKESVLKAVSGKALTKEQILDGVQKIGYKFSTKNPVNSLSVVLYGKKPKFKNQDGKFSVA
jgi:hypothetical protein